VGFWRQSQLLEEKEQRLGIKPKKRFHETRSLTRTYAAEWVSFGIELGDLRPNLIPDAASLKEGTFRWRVTQRVDRESLAGEEKVSCGFVPQLTVINR